MKRIYLLLLAFATCWQGLGAEEPAVAEAVLRNYVIQPADVLRLNVFQEPDLTQEVRVPQNGKYHFPLIGVVELTGKTVSEAEDLLRELYDRDYLVNPQINLLILEFSQRRVNVLGAVNAPGTIIFPPDEEMTLLDAISRAGGFNRLANRRAVTITRTDSEGEVTTYRINADELIRGNADSSLWKLQRGDVINVPERII